MNFGYYFSYTKPLNSLRLSSDGLNLWNTVFRPLYFVLYFYDWWNSCLTLFQYNIHALGNQWLTYNWFSNVFIMSINSFPEEEMKIENRETRLQVDRNVHLVLGTNVWNDKATVCWRHDYFKYNFYIYIYIYNIMVVI